MHEMSKPIFWENIICLTCAESAKLVVKVKLKSKGNGFHKGVPVWDLS